MKRSIESRRTHFPNRDKKHEEKFESELKLPSITMKQPLYSPQDLKNLRTHSRIVSNTQSDISAADEVVVDIEEQNDELLDANDALDAIEPGLEELPIEQDSDSVLEGEDIPAPINQEIEPEEMSLVDVVGMDDAIPTDQLECGLVGSSLLILSNNKSIAYMNEELAIQAGKQNVYTADEFPLVIATEIESKGLRKGLQSLGFKMTAINFDKQKIIKSSVQKQTTHLQKEIKAEAQKHVDALEDSLAIAAVGMNRNYFKGYDNVLKAALIQDLQNAGVKNVSKIVNRVFASASIGYTHTLLSLAEKLASMPGEVRDNHMQSLDMISEEIDIEDSVDLNDEIESNIDEDEIPPTVEAALSVPPKASLTAKRATSVEHTIKEILSGKKDLGLVLNQYYQ